MSRLSIIDSTGARRFLGNLFSPVLRYNWSIYGTTEAAPLVSRSLWPDLVKELGGDGADLSHPNLPYVHDQNGRGQCNANATTAAIEFCRSQQGLDFVQLSPPDLYDRINGGMDQGSLLEDAMREMLTRGIGTAKTAGLIWQPGQRTASDEERSLYKVLEAWLCPTFDHCFSAALKGFALISGIMWYENFTPGRDGWLPTRGSGQPGGHAVFGYKPMMRKSASGIEYGIAHQNSWGTGWGDFGGRCVFHEANYRGPVGGWWAVRLATTESKDLPSPLVSGSSKSFVVSLAPSLQSPTKWDVNDVVCQVDGMLAA